MNNDIILTLSCLDRNGCCQCFCIICSHLVTKRSSEVINTSEREDSVVLLSRVCVCVWIQLNVVRPLYRSFSGLD